MLCAERWIHEYNLNLVFEDVPDLSDVQVDQIYVVNVELIKVCLRGVQRARVKVHSGHMASSKHYTALINSVFFRGNIVQNMAVR